MTEAQKKPTYEELEQQRRANMIGMQKAVEQRMRADNEAIGAAVELDRVTVLAQRLAVSEAQLARQVEALTAQLAANRLQRRSAGKKK